MSPRRIDYGGMQAVALGGNQTTVDHGGGIQILRLPEALDLATADDVVGQGYAAIARRARLLLLDLTGTSFCDARGLSVFTRIANRAEATGCRYGLIGPQPPVARVLRISGLDARLPVFATIGDALAHLAACAPGCRALTRQALEYEYGDVAVATMGADPPDHLGYTMGCPVSQYRFVCSVQCAVPVRLSGW